MITHNVITVLIALLISISSAAQADDQLNQVDYPLISVPKGHYTLYIPDNNFFKLGYLEKKVSFDSIIHIGKFEVSNRLWNLCFKLNGCNRPVMMREGETLDSPVVRVNWHDAYGFSKWYSSYTNKSYRLPTEEEWVYAAYLGKDHRNIEIQYDYSDLNKIREISKTGSLTTPAALPPSGVTKDLPQPTKESHGYLWRGAGGRWEYCYGGLRGRARGCG